MHLLGILVDSLLETRDVDAGNAVKTTISNVCYLITRLIICLLCTVHSKSNDRKLNVIGPGLVFKANLTLN